MAYKDDFSPSHDTEDLSWPEIPDIQAPARKNPFVSIQHGSSVASASHRPATLNPLLSQKKKKISYFKIRKALVEKINTSAFNRRGKLAEQKTAKKQWPVLKKNPFAGSKKNSGDFASPTAKTAVHPLPHFASLKAKFSLKNTFAEFASGLAGGLQAAKTRFSEPPRLRMFPLIGGFLILAAILSAGAVTLGNIRKFPVSSSLLLPDEDSAQAALMAYISPDQPQDQAQSKEKLPPLPAALSVRNYTVRSGDSIASLAKRFGLRADTIIAMNNLQSQSSITAGRSLKIPNMDGIVHKVRKGENLSSIAKAYGADITKLVDVNELASATLNSGQSLFIPNARLASATLKNFYGESFVWPVRGSISSPFGYRSNPFSGLRTFHSAIDIVVNKGTPVKATSDGIVADTGYNSVFGNYIIIRHDNGYQSLYAHLSEISVRQGSKVTQSATIGRSGNTGQSTGPHLHFSIFKNGQALDPRKLLK